MEKIGTKKRFFDAISNYLDSKVDYSSTDKILNTVDVNKVLVRSFSIGGPMQKNNFTPEFKVNTKLNVGYSGLDPWGGYWRHQNGRDSESSISDDYEPDEFISSMDGLYSALPSLEGKSSKRDKKEIQKVSKDAWAVVYDKFRDKFNLNNTQYALLMGQLAHETGNFSSLEEIGSSDYFKRYEGKLGNNNSGDGEKYKGRGPIQLTGKWNYEQAQKWFDKIGLSEAYKEKTGKDLNIVENPDTVAYDPIIGAYATMCYISVLRPKVMRIIQNSNVESPDQVTNSTIKDITYEINGGYNGLSDRIIKTRSYLKQLTSNDTRGDYSDFRSRYDKKFLDKFSTAFDNPNYYKYQNTVDRTYKNLYLKAKEYNPEVSINSGFRSREHNARVGGSKTSKHLTGRAIDFGFYEKSTKNI